MIWKITNGLIRRGGGGIEKLKYDNVYILNNMNDNFKDKF